MTDTAPGSGTHRPWRTSWSDVTPFVVVAFMGVAILPFGWRRVEPGIIALFIGLTALTLTMISISIRRSRRSWMATAAPFLVFVDLALARYLAGPTVASGIAPLVLLPVLWVALRGTRVELVVAGFFAAAFFWVPAVVIGPPAYQRADLYRGLLTAAMALLVAPVIQRVVRRLAAANAQERLSSQRAEAVTTRLRTLLMHLPDTVVAAVNESDTELVGLEGLGGTQESQQHFLNIMRRHPDAVRQLFERATGDTADVELFDESSGQTLFATAVPLPGTTPVEMLLVVRDVTRDKQREWALERSRRQLAYLADHDPASGLLNRRRFDQLLAEHVSNGDRGALLMLDLDRFKQVNDTLGHAAGDRLIVRVAGILQEELRSSDSAARLGGDEFAILLPHADATGATTVAGRLVQRVKDSGALLGDRHPPVTASIGVATFAAAKANETDPMALADNLLYKAKSGGRDRFVTFEDEYGDSSLSVRPASRHTRIKRALQNGQLVLHVQPIIELATNRLVCAEALLRVREDGQLLPPAEFIEAAEASGLITRVDCHVLREGVALLARLRQFAPDFRLAINVSARSVGAPVVEETILTALRNHGLPGSALIIEITETAALTEIRGAERFAAQMKRVGTSLSLDDFGSGFGSFNRLKRLSFDYVKIYGEFVAAARESPVDRALMRSIIRVAHELDKRVVAEHVADEETLELVRTEGADFAQGFHLGPPMAANEFIDRCLRG